MGNDCRRSAALCGIMKPNQAILEATTEPRGEVMRARLRAFSTTRMVQLHIDRQKRRGGSAGEGGQPASPGGQSPLSVAAASPTVARPSEAEDQWEELSSQPPFAGLPEAGRARVQAGLLGGRAQYLALPRDRLLDAAGRGVWVLAGQLVLAVIDRATLRELREAATTASEPGATITSRRVRQNLVCFEAGDLVESGPLYQAFAPALSAHPDCELGFYTLAHSALFLVNSGELASWGRADDGLAPARERAQRAATARLPQASGATPGAMDYFIRHGLPLAETVRLLDLSQCIGCGACEATCADLYGRNRLQLQAGPVFYELKTIGTCRTCSDQRCVAACAYDAIHFVAEKGEVKIDEFACIGCSACSTACPYNAIEMRSTSPETPFGEKLQARLTAAGELVQIGKRRSVADPSRTRIASKCDHCESYGGQQACIAVCPGGPLTLSEYSPGQALQALSESERRARAAAGLSPPPILGPAVAAAPASAAAAPTSPRQAAAGTGRALSVLWVAAVVFAGLGACEFVLQKTALVRSLHSLFGLLGQRPLLASHSLRLLFGWTGLSLMGLAALFALRRLYLRQTQAVVRPSHGAGAWLRRAILQGSGDFRVHSWAGGAALLLVVVHAWYPWRTLAGISAALGVLLLSLSGGAIRGLSSRLRARRAVLETELASLRLEVQRLRVSSSLARAGEELLSRLVPPRPPKRPSPLAVGSALGRWLASGLGLGGDTDEVQRLSSDRDGPQAILRFQRNVAERLRRARLLQRLPDLEGGAELARLVHLPLCLIVALAVIVHVCEKYRLF